MRGYHIGLIPDGNRRWAREKGLKPWKGHEEGAKKAELFIEWCIDHKEIGMLTIYTLSEENFSRPEEELNELFDIYGNELLKLIEKEEIHRDRVKINVVSTNIDPLPAKLLAVFNRVTTETQDYGDKVLNLLIGYTGQSELLQAVSSPRNRLKNLFFGLRGKDVVAALKIKEHCDFIIRTGEESEEREARSGFLLWQSAYSEYYHINKYYPDVTREEFDKAWEYFLTTKRKKGH